MLSPIEAGGAISPCTTRKVWGRDSVAVTDEEADALAEILGAPQVTRVLAEPQRQTAGLVIEQLPLPAGSPLRPTRNGLRSRIVRVAPPGAPPSG